MKLTVKPDKKDWNAEKPSKQFTASSIAKNKVLMVDSNKIFLADTHF